MDFKIKDSNKIFELNDSLNIEVKHIEGFPVVEIKDFYKHPEMIRDLALDTPVSLTNVGSTNAYPGRRGVLHEFNDNMDFKSTIFRILHDKMGLDVMQHDIHDRRDFAFNIFSKEIDSTNTGRTYKPHMDENTVSALVYLNNESQGGTAIYKHKESGILFCPKDEKQVEWFARNQCSDFLEAENKVTKLKYGINKLKLTEPETFILDGNEEFELMYKSSGDFNTFVAFFGGMYHSPYVNYQNLDEPRVSQVMFIRCNDTFNQEI